MAQALALQQRIADIHPGCDGAQRRGLRRTPTTGRLLLPQPVDAVIDACDQVRAKVAIASWAADASASRWSCAGAAGGKRAAHRVEVADLAEVTHDPLLAAVRQRLRKGRRAAQWRDRRALRVLARERCCGPARPAVRSTTTTGRRQPQLPRLRLQRGGDGHLRHGRCGRGDGHARHWPLDRDGRAVAAADACRLRCYNARLYAGSLAQSVEQRTFNPLVAGSNPARPTIGTEVRWHRVRLRALSSAGRAADS